MSLVERIESDHAAARVSAQQGGDKVPAALLGTLIGELRSEARKVENRGPTDEEAKAKILKFLATARQNIERTGAARPELVPGFEAEIALLSAYVPAAPGDDEVRAAVAGYRAANPDAKVGAVMGHLRERFGASLDGRRASELAKAA